LEAGQDLPPRTIAITIDDCDTSFFEIGWPMFQKYQMPLFCSIITSYIGRKLNVGTEITLTNRDQLENLIESGLVVLGSHSETHPKLNALNQEKIVAELGDSKKVIESIQGHCTVFCYPYGDVSVITSEGEQSLVEMGYRYALTTISGPVKKGADRLRIGRTNVVNSIGEWKIPYYCNGIVCRLIQIKKLIWGERFYSDYSPGGKIAF
jgi:peptidoglycan/xylan/chitin deacetylase (PgdA/CDA1 family)